MSTRPPKPQLEVIDPRWLLKALALTLAAGALLAYLTLCLLIYQGSWQLLLHPSPTIDRTPAEPFQSIRFDAVNTGQPRLTAWWIPAEESAFAHRPRTLLYLHDGTGSLSTCVAKLQLLHRTGVNIFAIDYRGFGQSDAPHPTEARMVQDTAAALEYLLNTRHIPPAQLIPYGEGLGAVLATDISNAHPELPAFILDNPDPDAFSRATSDVKSRFLPMHVLVQEHFDLAQALNANTHPKLLFTGSPFVSDLERTRVNQKQFTLAPSPKMTVTFDNPHSGDVFVQSITRFLDEYAP